MAHSELPEIRARFLEDQLGEPDLVLHPVLTEVPHIEVNVYAPVTGRRPYFTLVTNGLSDLLLEVPYHHASDWSCDRAELVMYLADVKLAPNQTQLPWEVELLRKLARLPGYTDLRPAAFMALPHRTPPRPYARGSDLTHAVFLPPWHEPLPFRDGFDAPDGTSVDYLWLDLMTSAEAAFLEQRGPAAFLSLLQAAGHEPPTRLYRGCHARAEEGLVVPSSADGNRVRQLATHLYRPDGKGQPVYVIKARLDIADAAAAEPLVARFVKQVAVQRACSPPQTAALAVFVVGDLTAPAFAALWRQHLADSPAMAFFMSKMSVAAVVQGNHDGERLSECSLLEPAAG